MGYDCLMAINRSFVCLLVAVTVSGCTRSDETPRSTGSDKPLAAGIDHDSIDKNVRPQDDLFHHANGAWLAKTEIPPDKSSYGAFDMLIDSRSSCDCRRCGTRLG
jgi:hypothetical protein